MCVCAKVASQHSLCGKQVNSSDASVTVFKSEVRFKHKILG